MTGLPTPRLPTTVGDWRVTARTIRLVLTIPQYAVLSIGFGVVGLSVFVLSRNLQLVRQVVLGGTLPLDARLRVLVELYPGVGTAYTAVQSVALVATAVLIGVNLAVVAYHVREHEVSLSGGSGSLSGVVLGTLGAGCAACGSAVLAGLLSFFGAAGALLLLPLDGLEFTLAALVVLVLSLYWLADGMRGGEIAGCPVEPGRALDE